MTTFLKLLLLGCICLSACSQQNKGVRSADELFKELESAYQKKDSVAFEKFFKEWNEISKDSLRTEKHSDISVQNLYDIMNDVYRPKTLHEPEPGINGNRATDERKRARYGIVQTSIDYCMSDSAEFCEKSIKVDNFYPKTKKSADSILFLFPQYGEAVLKFFELPNNSNYDRFNSLNYWVRIYRDEGFIDPQFGSVGFNKDFTIAKISARTSDILFNAKLKKLEGKWIQVIEK